MIRGSVKFGPGIVRDLFRVNRFHPGEPAEVPHIKPSPGAPT
jgi:hypothetical protein